MISFITLSHCLISELNSDLAGLRSEHKAHHVIISVVSSLIVETVPRLGGTKCAAMQRNVGNVPEVLLCGHSVSQQASVGPLWSAAAPSALLTPSLHSRLSVPVSSPDFGFLQVLCLYCQQLGKRLVPSSHSKNIYLINE